MKSSEMRAMLEREMAASAAQRRAELVDEGYDIDDVELLLYRQRELTRAQLLESRFGRFRPLTLEDILPRQPTDWLIEDVLEQGAQTILYGPSGQGKTFVALDWALSVATGRAWHERRVHQGPVWYVVAEGARGLRTRVAAWLRHHDVTDHPEAYFLMEAVQLRKDHRDLVESMQKQQVRPVLVILDTFARCFLGGDENTSKDVGEFIEGMRQVQEATGATVVAVHHTGKANDQERGSSALRAAADAMFKVSMPKGDIVVIENDKQKDHGESPTIRLSLRPVLADTDESSCVLTSAEPDNPQSALTRSQQRALAVLAGFPEKNTSVTEWRERLRQEIGGRLSPKTFDNWRRALIQAGQIEEVADHRQHYRVIEGVLPRGNETDVVKDTAEQPIASAATATTP